MREEGIFYFYFLKFSFMLYFLNTHLQLSNDLIIEIM